MEKELIANIDIDAQLKDLFDRTEAANAASDEKIKKELLKSDVKDGKLVNYIPETFSNDTKPDNTKEKTDSQNEKELDIETEQLRGLDSTAEERVEDTMKDRSLNTSQAIEMVERETKEDKENELKNNRFTDKIRKIIDQHENPIDKIIEEKKEETEEKLDNEGERDDKMVEIERDDKKKEENEKRSNERKIEEIKEVEKSREIEAKIEVKEREHERKFEEFVKHQEKEKKTTEMQREKNGSDKNDFAAGTKRDLSTPVKDKTSSNIKEIGKLKLFRWSFHGEIVISSEEGIQNETFDRNGITKSYAEAMEKIAEARGEFAERCAMLTESGKYVAKIADGNSGKTLSSSNGTIENGTIKTANSNKTSFVASLNSSRGSNGVGKGNSSRSGGVSLGGGSGGTGGSAGGGGGGNK